MSVSKIWKIGVTGGIGSGKSNVLKVCASLGVATIDADILGHRTYEPGTDAFKKVVESFGKEVVAEDGSINRKVLGSKVFGPQNKDNMKKLTDIVWPTIGELAQKEMKSLEDKGVSLVIMEGAVIIEAGWTSFLDELWVTMVPPEVAVQRIMKRNNISEEEANNRIKSQISNEERKKLANVVINTDRPIEQTNEYIKQLLEEARKKHSNL
eukprot:TRINITY_DN365_c0_g1_i1.p2 TRINITY_DN365_c0_g1~~TRINITY_DN365_c0_g1_i1.p2  ORF type:complete len:210 (+),score=53.48 TRINITY_DN365_c0_g1_i1:1874-2503(+)